MHGASLRQKLVPCYYTVRAGEGHRTHGDGWTFGALVRMRGPVAFIELGKGGPDSNDNYRSQRAVLRLLAEQGIRRAWWIRDPESGAIGWVDL